MRTLAERLTWARVQADLTQQELATKSGVAQSTIASWESGARETGRKIPVVAEVLGVSPLWLAEGRGDAELLKDQANTRTQSDVDDAPDIIATPKRLPVVGRVQAGPDGMLTIDDYPPGQGDGFMVWHSACNQSYALRIRGESMSPRYRPGEFVGVDPCAEVMPSDEVIATLKNGQKMIKRLLWMRDGQACFESVNEDFPNIILDIDEIESLHLVIGHIHKSAFRSF